jgi:hypothetical protein|tara:strand:- start:619 stop:933 length:315 start_codon:yes stop_codon:yes gene_type:complete
VAAGDIFANASFNVGTGGTSIIPAASVNVMITSIGGNNASGRLFSKGVFSVLRDSPGGASGGAGVNFVSWEGNMNMKHFITNSEFIQFRASTGTMYCFYTGIEF